MTRSARYGVIAIGVGVLMAHVVTLPLAPLAADLSAEYGGAVIVVRPQSKKGDAISPGYGTGWLVSYDGLAITARHVVSADGRIEPDDLVLWAAIQGESYPARLIPLVTDLDMALIQVEFRGRERAKAIFERFQYDPPAVGERLWLLGHPSDSLRMEPRPATPISIGGVSVFAAEQVLDGFSGGPVLTEAGQVVAMTIGVTEDDQRRPVRAHYLSMKTLDPLLEYVVQHGDRVRPQPTWLRYRPKNLFRDEEVAKALTVLRGGRSLLLTGGPGMELTDFAVEVGHRMWEEEHLSSGNVLYISSSTGESTESTMLTKLVEQLDLEYLKSVTEDRKFDGIRRRMERTERFLILADGLSDEKAVKTLLRLRNRNPVLVTMPEVASSDFDEILVLRGLPVDKCVELFKQESQLSLDRGADLRAVENLCTAVGGGPLAVRLVAGRVKLEFGLARGQGRSVPRKVSEVVGDFTRSGLQTELDDFVTVACRRLLPSQYLVLQRLSVIDSESFGIDAAIAVGLVGEAIRTELRRLTAASLIEVVGHERYRLNPLVRNVVARDLEKNDLERSRAQRAMIRHYLTEFDGKRPGWSEEWSAVISALKVCAALGGNEGRRCVIEEVPRVRSAMQDLGQWETHQEWVGRWLKAAEDENVVSEQRAALVALAQIDLNRGQYIRAQERIEKARALVGPADPLDIVRIRYAVARFEIDAAARANPPSLDKLEEAKKLAGEGLTLAGGLPASSTQTELLAHGLQILGVASEIEGNYRDAAKAYGQSLARAERGSHQWLASSFHSATLEFRQNHLDEARHRLVEILDLARAERLDEARAHSLYMLARVSCRQKQFVSGVEYMAEAVEVYDRLGSRYLADAVENLRALQSSVKGQVSNVEGC